MKTRAVWMLALALLGGGSSTAPWRSALRQPRVPHRHMARFLHPRRPRRRLLFGRLHLSG